MSLQRKLAATRALCEEALRDPVLIASEQVLGRGRAPYWIERIVSARVAPPELLALRQETAGAPGYPLERALLVRAALSFLDRIESLPVEESVRQLICKEIAFMAAPPADRLSRFDMTTYPFLVMCLILAGKRYPAGQLHWEVSGFSRRWLAKVPLLKLPRALVLFLAEAHGFYPYFETHLNPTTYRTGVLLERAYYQSFYRAARSLEMQPAIRGIMAVSWLHSLETFRISPHLSFLNKPYEEAGGLIIPDIGPAPTTAGFLEGDAERARLYKSGEYRPTLAVAICARRQAIEWARGNPEIARQAAVVG